MKKIVLFLSIIVIISGCSKFNTVETDLNISDGSVERFENFPSKFVSLRNVDVWLPKDYSNDEKYAVIYMHDGQMLFDGSKTWNNQEWGVDEIISDLIDNNKIKKCIVVGIWNSGEGRHSEYFPQKPFESLDIKYQDSLLLNARRYNTATLFAYGLQSDNYLKFIVNELKPIIDYTYSTLPDKENTIIMGSSMGGLISMYGICEYPEVFGGAGCLSTHWVGTFDTTNNPIPGSFVDYISKNIPDPMSHRIYYDYGTHTLDGLYEPSQLRVDSVMEISGYTTSNWITKKFVGANHSEKAWRNRLHIPITFLLSKN